MFKKETKISDLDRLLHTELDKFEAEMENEEKQSNTFAGVISQKELSQILQVCKDSVESVFGPIIFNNEVGVECIRHASLEILQTVLAQICPRQPIYNVVEHINSDGEEN